MPESRIVKPAGEAAPSGRSQPFVGRAAELANLCGRLADARTGRGGVAILSGEPGIGKTRLAEQLAAEARQQGFLVLWGRCFEGDWSPPFTPWAEALGRYAAAAEPARLRGELGTGAPPLAEVVSAVRTVLPDLPRPAPLGPEEDRFRVADTLTQFLLAIARRQPALLVLDDLQWADPASVGQLRHLARFLPDAALLVLGTYRDTELRQRGALAVALAEIRRGPRFTHHRLSGLNEPETEALLAGATGRAVDHDLARSIHAETSGNPFFAGELIRHLLDTGALAATEGQPIAATRAGSVDVPEGVRQVVGLRLSRLSAATNRLLSHAAIFTGGFDFRVLQALTGLSDEDLLDALDEALASGLIRPLDERSETYDFVHAIIRHALAAEWSPSRRVRLHRRLAEALERVHAGHELALAAELAVQYHASASLPGAAKGVLYALAAAEHARAAPAREQAVTFLRMAHDLATTLDQRSRASILCRLAVAEAEALLLDDARRTVEQALAALAAANEPADTIAGFITTVATALEDGGTPTRVWQPLVERGLALVGDRRDLTWARLKLTLKPYEPIATGIINASRWLGSDPRAVAIARSGGQEDDFAKTVQAFDVRSPEETRALVARARRWQRPAAVIRALEMAGADSLYYHGNLQEAIATFEELLATAEQYGSIAGRVEALIRLAIAWTVLGEHEQARRLAAEAHALVDRLGPGHHLRASAAWTTAHLTEHLGGDWPAIAAFWTRFVADPKAAENALVVDDAALAAYAQARAGNAAAARRLLAALTPVLERMAPTDWLINGAIAFGGSAVWTLEAADLAAAYLTLARSLLAVGMGDYPGTSTELTIARMASLLCNRSEATEHFARARAATIANGRRPLRAIVDHDEALALVRAGNPDPERVDALCTDAAVTFAELGMLPWAARIVELRQAAARAAERGRGALPAGLTEREVDVLRLVARGCSDREISDRLFLSPRTVNAHLRNMFRKVDVTNRTELSIWAVEHGLVGPGTERTTDPTPSGRST